MKKMLTISGLNLLGAIAALFGTLLYLGYTLTAGVNHLAPEVTKTKVILGGSRISPLSGSVTLSDLAVGNPAGWSERDLCTVGRIHVKVAPWTLFNDAIVIEEITIEAPEFNYETKIIASNVNDLLKNIEASLGTGGKQATPDAKPAGGTPKKFVVKKFRLQEGKVRLGLAGAGATLPLPLIELTDLGVKEGGITSNQLAFAAMKSVTASIVSATAQAATDIGRTGGAGAAESVKQVGEAIKGLFSGKK